MKVHLLLRDDFCECGLPWTRMGEINRDPKKTTCKTCLKAHAAWQRRKEILK